MKAGTPLGFSIPTSMTKTILGKEFVDLAGLLNDNSVQLLSHSQQNQNTDLVFAIDGGADGDEACI